MKNLASVQVSGTAPLDASFKYVRLFPARIPQLPVITFAVAITGIVRELIAASTRRVAALLLRLDAGTLNVNAGIGSFALRMVPPIRAPTIGGQASRLL